MYVWSTVSSTRMILVRGTPAVGFLIHWVIISRRWERIQQRDSESPIYTDSPRKKKCCDRFQAAKSQAPKTPRTDTILPEHLLAHTLITYVYSHYCIWSFCHHFPCKNDGLITSTRIEFSNHENIAVAYTNFLCIASCHIVNVRYHNDLLVTEIRIVVSYLSFKKQYFYENDVQSCDKQLQVLF